MKLSPRARELSQEAAAAQRSFFRLHRIQLGLILVAAAVGVVPLTFGRQLNWAGLIAAALFGVSILMRVLLVDLRDEERWFGARRDAERAKSLCFRYAYGARGFERGDDEREVRKRFVEAAAGLGEALVARPASTDTRSYSDISEDMAIARSLPLPEARERYAAERIADQETWFAGRALSSRRRARIALGVMMGAQVLGLIFGILTAVDLAPEAFVGLMSAIAASAIAWSQLRQYSLLGNSYAAQARRLRAFGRELDLLDDDAWPDFVSRVEDSFRLEQDTWQGFQGHGR